MNSLQVYEEMYLQEIIAQISSIEPESYCTHENA